jgi:hypothetical protein
VNVQIKENMQNGSSHCGLNPEFVSMMEAYAFTIELREFKVLCQLPGYHLSNLRNKEIHPGCIHL